MSARSGCEVFIAGPSDGVCGDDDFNGALDEAWLSGSVGLAARVSGLGVSGLGV